MLKHEHWRDLQHLNGRKKIENEKQNGFTRRVGKNAREMKKINRNDINISWNVGDETSKVR